MLYGLEYWAVGRRIEQRTNVVVIRNSIGVTSKVDKRINCDG